jgi:hypothetical protein
MTRQSTRRQTELAQRASDGVEITLYWVRGEGGDKVVVTVQDSRDGSSFEIPAEPHLALDVYYHPFAYRSFGIIVDDDTRRAEVVR